MKEQGCFFTQEQLELLKEISELENNPKYVPPISAWPERVFVELKQNVMKNYWFSFSSLGGNNGVCIVQADTPQDAKDKAENLKLIPECDHIFCCEITDEKEISKFEFNRLYTPEDMIALGYVPKKSLV
jgi:hypothetical protein